MKFIVIKNNLKDALSVVERASSITSGLPALRNVMIEAKNNLITLTTTNLEIAISFFVSGKVIEDGKAAVSISTFSEVINNTQEDRLNIEKKHADISITTDNHQITIKGSPVDEFPIIPKIKNNTENISIKTDIFKEALQQVLYATQHSDLRPELNNLLLLQNNELLKIAGTDSFRLAEKNIPKGQFESTGKGGVKALIPLKTSQELLRVLGGDDKITITFDENQVLFKTDHFEFISRLSEGNFPDYEAVIPKSFSAEAVIEKQEFMQALKLAGVFSTRTSEIKIKVPKAKKIIEISSSDQATGENKGVLSAKTSGSSEEIGFNWKYLLDGMKAVNSAEVYIGVNEEKPALIKSQNDATYFYILIPNLQV